MHLPVRRLAAILVLGTALLAAPPPAEAAPPASAFTGPSLTEQGLVHQVRSVRHRHRRHHPRRAPRYAPRYDGDRAPPRY